LPGEIPEFIIVFPGSWLAIINEKQKTEAMHKGCSLFQSFRATPSFVNNSSNIKAAEAKLYVNDLIAT
jgi:hypothetical protein